MQGIKFTAKCIQDQNGAKSVQVVLEPQDSSLIVEYTITPASAREVGNMLLSAADLAERVIVMPSFDGVPPRQA